MEYSRWVYFLIKDGSIARPGPYPRAGYVYKEKLSPQNFKGHTTTVSHFCNSSKWFHSTPSFLLPLPSLVSSLHQPLMSLPKRTHAMCSTQEAEPQVALEPAMVSTTLSGPMELVKSHTPMAPLVHTVFNGLETTETL
jgi:hypothetical protein